MVHHVADRVAINGQSGLCPERAAAGLEGPRLSEVVIAGRGKSLARGLGVACKPLDEVRHRIKDKSSRERPAEWSDVYLVEGERIQRPFRELSDMRREAAQRRGVRVRLPSIPAPRHTFEHAPSGSHLLIELWEQPL